MEYMYCTPNPPPVVLVVSLVFSLYDHTGWGAQRRSFAEPQDDTHRIMAHTESNLTEP